MQDWKEMGTQERSEAIRPYIEAELSASKIAAKFQNATRNSILGHIHRTIGTGALKVKRPVGRPRKSATKTEKRPPRPIGNMKSVPLPKMPEPPNPELALPFMDALSGNVCKWPLWDEWTGPETSMCCGASRKHDEPYCEFHMDRNKGRGTEGERSADRVLEKFA